jgi:hypothetical protein
MFLYVPINANIIFCCVLYGFRFKGLRFPYQQETGCIVTCRIWYKLQNLFKISCTVTKIHRHNASMPGQWSVIYCAAACEPPVSPDLQPVTKFCLLWNTLITQRVTSMVHHLTIHEIVYVILFICSIRADPSHAIWINSSKNFNTLIKL